jgi:TatD DNase family protein
MDLGRDIRYIDFHTHNNTGSADTIAVLNLMAGEDITADPGANTLFSAGIHPWNLTAENAVQLKTELILTSSHPHVVIIGEAGFDRLRGPSPEVQREAFIFQAQLAEEMRKPLLIHCVRYWDELTGAKEEINPSVPWIIHGFRGKSDLAASLAGKGFWFSLGPQGINPQVIEVIDRERILLETDDSVKPVSEVYRLFSDTLHCDPEAASDLIRKNFNSLFNAIS